MVEGLRAHKSQRIVFIFISLLLLGQLPFFSTHAEQMTPSKSSSPEGPDLLIFLSPQYAQDTEIYSTLLLYCTVVKTDLGWITRIIRLTENENDFQTIDTLIEKTYNAHPLKACIMVGEDIDTALSGDTDYLEQPSILPWLSLGGRSSYTMTDQGILCVLKRIDICISLLYPTHTLPYEQKREMIIFVFNKFTHQRNITKQDTIRVFESSEINTDSKTLYQALNKYGSLLYTEDPTNEGINASLQQPYTAYFVHGHSTPAGTNLNTENNTIWFSTRFLDTIQTPLFGADGCYVGGWWSNQSDNNKLDQSIDADWYGSKIFTSRSLHVMALGLLSQTGFPTSVSFIENVMPGLLQGKTLADAMIGQNTIGDTIIVGDPTFHFVEE